MAAVTLDKVSKTYGNGFKALHSLDLHVADGEFMILVGPSGCGKTTALRMVAGLEEITEGKVLIGDRVVNNMPAKRRDIAMVFQNYALYPHMTVRKNIGFALKLRNRPKAEIKAKVEEAATILGLTEWLERKPGQLSGGQRQRVAMGRAIVREPAAFLMDEPLSNLDAKLRVQMRAEVARIQRRIGVATIYVTHDQVEAMTMGDRVAVMSQGVLQQCDTPQNVYDHPKNLFVAAFIGSPAMNLYEAGLTEGARSIKLGSQDFLLNDMVLKLRPALAAFVGRRVIVGIRPEDLSPNPNLVGADGGPRPTLEAEVEILEALGPEMLVHFVIDAPKVEAEGALESDAEGLNAGTLVRQGAGVAKVDPRFTSTTGGRIQFQVDPARLHFFDPSTGDAIGD